MCKEEYLLKLFFKMSKEICLSVEIPCVSNAIANNGTVGKFVCFVFIVGLEDIWFVYIL